MQIGPDEEWLCRTAYVLTVYLRESPTRAHALEAWRVYASVCPRNAMKFIMHKKMAEFDELPSVPGESDIEPYMREMDRRLDQGILIWDGGEASCWSFNIEGIFEPDEPAQASFCQIIFPDDVQPDAIIEAARGLGDCLPFLSGHAGYTALFSTSSKKRAFDQIYAWAKRYLGLEVEDLNRTLPVVLDAIKGANWLTLISRNFWERLKDRDNGPQLRLPSGPIIEFRAHGTLITAGDRPILGDRNRGEFPDIYASVEELIRPVKVTSHPEFMGRFEENAETMAWLNRLIDPSHW
jgi:hypothetical protein